MKLQQVLGIAVGAIAMVAATGYWYVMIAGAPQLDPPKVAKDTGMKFQLATFSSQALGGDRSYGVILPPGYEQHPKAHYPVIVLLHGGHGDARAWQDKAAVTTVLHTLYSQHRMPLAIVVTPDGNDRRGTSPFWDP